MLMSMNCDCANVVFNLNKYELHGKIRPYMKCFIRNRDDLHD